MNELVYSPFFGLALTAFAYILGTLGCATAAYAPFMFFAMLNPIMSLICIWTGWTIERIDDSQKDLDIIP